MYYFLSGYTSKVAGTETGIMKPEAVFSSCFGEPFMVLDPRVYGELLRKKIEEHGIRCWSINTGWTGGGYNSGGERISISHTRLLLDAALSGDLDDVPMIEHDIFEVMIPTMCKGVPNEMLDPIKTWENKEDYTLIANQLYLAFEENYTKFNIDKNNVKEIEK
jgi:phosphoenolpyruvate carboxykinase (ATP)